MSSTGPTSTTALLSRSSGIEPPKIEGRNFVMYRTPEEIRAIPNEQWETWILTNTMPWPAFSAERRCQMVMRWILKVTVRRMLAGFHR